MLKKITYAFIISIMLTLAALPILAAPPPQGGDGVHFGPFTLKEGESVSGDQVVFGDVKLRGGSRLTGDLVVFGAVLIEEDADLIGELVILGEAEIAGAVDGDIFAAGDIILAESAHIYGDISAVGEVNHVEGAVIDGQIIPLDEDDFDWSFPMNGPFPFIQQRIESGRPPTPTWVQILSRIFRSILTVVLITLLALVIVSIWPEPTERIGEVIEASPALAFGMGLLVFLVTFIVELILFITICLIPFALLGWLVIIVGLLMGWVAFGLVLGRRILSGIFHQSEPSTLLAAVLGTAIVTFVIELAGVLPPLRGLAYLLLLPLSAGAVVLTRFGMRPYAIPIKRRQRLTASPQAPPVPRTPHADPRAETEAPVAEEVAEDSRSLSPFNEAEDEAEAEAEDKDKGSLAEASGEETSASETSEDEAES
ncbi:MAG: polymer-forming cytoskeletal protein [Anaerolineales bacterium]